MSKFRKKLKIKLIFRKLNKNLEKFKENFRLLLLNFFSFYTFLKTQLPHCQTQAYDCGRGKTRLGGGQLPPPPCPMLATALHCNRIGDQRNDGKASDLAREGKCGHGMLGCSSVRQKVGSLSASIVDVRASMICQKQGAVYKNFQLFEFNLIFNLSEKQS